MTPIQLWLPTVQGGIARPELRGDMQRMFRAWTIEDIMWTKPRWAGPPRWVEGQWHAACLNGETLERAQIHHVGDNGAIVGPSAASFPDQSVNGLLDTWLNADIVKWSPIDPDRAIRLEVPHPVEGGVALVWMKITFPFTNVLPIKHVDDRGIAFAQWPPDPTMPTTISPEVESALPTPSFSPPPGTLPVRFSWTAPFDLSQPMIVTPDDLYARDQMRLIAELSGKDNHAARKQAEIEARDWLSEGQASADKVWLQPIISAEGEEGALFALESRFGISASSLSEAYSDAELKKQLEQAIPVLRAWGVPGLMWALLLDRLKAAQPLRKCERCGRLISGKADKRFCSATDDPVCYRDRKKEDKRRARSRGD
jgi:hypothetical protein